MGQKNKPVVEDIYPERFSLWSYSKKIIQYKSFLYYLSLKWIRIKYEESHLGILWVIINPIFIGVIYSVCLGWALNTNKSGVNYFLFVYSGLIPWQFFRDTFLDTADCFLREPNVLKRSNFPRIIVPLSILLPKLLELLVGYFILTTVVLIKGSVSPTHLPVILLLIIDISLISLGLGMAFIYLFTCYRDVKHFFRFIFPFLIYLMPVLYDSRKAPAALQVIFNWNPIAWLLIVQRELLFNDHYITAQLLQLTLSGFLIFLAGVFVFTQVENKLADFI